MAGNPQIHVSPSWKPRRTRAILNGITAAFFLVLLVLGVRGRSEALIEVRLSDLRTAAEKLVAELHNELTAADRFLGRNSPTHQAIVAEQARQLRVQLEAFRSSAQIERLAGDKAFVFRMANAALAVVEGRSPDAQALAEETSPLAILHAEALFAQQQWKEALLQYQKFLQSHPAHLSALARAADSMAALGRSDEALTNYVGLARAYIRRGDELLRLEQSGPAAPRYELAIAILQQLPEAWQVELNPEFAQACASRADAHLLKNSGDAALADFSRALARNDSPGLRVRRGSAFLLQGKLEPALADLTNAVATLGTQTSGTAAAARHHLGNVLLAQGKLAAAHAGFSSAIEIIQALPEAARASLIGELARSYNNRGVVNRGLGKLQEALNDFEAAGKLMGNQSPQAEAGSLVSVEVAMGYSENSLDALLRPRLNKHQDDRELTTVRALSLRNSGYVRLAQGDAQLAAENFRISAELLARLVTQDGEQDLASQLSKSLAALAVTAAKRGNFADAVKHQESALHLASGRAKAELEARLESYRSGKADPLPPRR